MRSTVLIVIDVQTGLFTEPGYPVYQKDSILRNINALIAKARSADVPVFFVQHTESEGPLQLNTPGWKIHSALDVRDSDVRFIKTSPDSFYKTPLESLLKDRGITDLVLCGLQTEYCVDTTTRSAFSHGYRTFLVSDAHSTYDNDLLKASQIVAHHNGILRSFADLKTTQDIQFK